MFNYPFYSEINFCFEFWHIKCIGKFQTLCMTSCQASKLPTQINFHTRYTKKVLFHHPCHCILLSATEVGLDRSESSLRRIFHFSEPFSVGGEIISLGGPSKIRKKSVKQSRNKISRCPGLFVNNKMYRAFHIKAIFNTDKGILLSEGSIYEKQN